MRCKRQFPRPTNAQRRAATFSSMSGSKLAEPALQFAVTASIRKFQSCGKSSIGWRTPSFPRNSCFMPAHRKQARPPCSFALRKTRRDWPKEESITLTLSMLRRALRNISFLSRKCWREMCKVLVRWLSDGGSALARRRDNSHFLLFRYGYVRNSPVSRRRRSRMRRRASQRIVASSGARNDADSQQVSPGAGDSRRDSIEDSRGRRHVWRAVGILPAERGIDEIDQEAHREKPTLNCATISRLKVSG